jgi:hypothetical protein
MAKWLIVVNFVKKLGLLENGQFFINFEEIFFTKNLTTTSN